MEVQQPRKEETFIQTSRRAREWQRLAAGAERTRSKVAAGGPSKVGDCGMGQAVQQLADPTRWQTQRPHILA